MQLYYFPGTIAVASALALQEAGLDHTLVHVDFTTGAQTQPDYLKINPKARVPALVTAGAILTATGALLDYIAARAGTLMPDTAKVPETMTACARYVEDTCLMGPFILGPQITVGDCYLFAVCDWLPADGVDLAAFPKIRAFMDAMNARPSVAAIRAAGVLA